MASVSIPQLATNIRAIGSPPLEHEELIRNLRRQTQIVANLIEQIEKEARLMERHWYVGRLLELAEMADHASCDARLTASDLYDAFHADGEDKTA